MKIRISHDALLPVRTGAALFLLLLPILTSAQSGWTKKKGELFGQFSAGQLASDQYYNLAGEQMNTSRFRQYFASLYGEYGLSNRFTLIANWPVYKFHGFETTETVSGIGDLGLGIKYGLPLGKIPVSIALTPEFPTGRANLLAQNQINRFEFINLPTGDGEFNLHGTLAASASLHPLPVYGSLFADYNYRTQFSGTDFSDQLTLGIEVGGKFFDHLWLQGRLLIQNTLNRDPNRAVEFIRGEGTEYTAFSLGLNYEIDKTWGISLNYYGYADWIVSRKNLYNAGPLSIGLNYQLRKD